MSTLYKQGPSLIQLITQEQTRDETSFHLIGGHVGHQIINMLQWFCMDLVGVCKCSVINLNSFMKLSGHGTLARNPDVVYQPRFGI